ncbi:MAG: hypothetical protein JXA04_01030 [Gammaproteobacteria bacterium]|nr:hypothetical protein [Gammaproteobacteria bacterium]
MMTAKKYIRLFPVYFVLTFLLACGGSNGDGEEDAADGGSSGSSSGGSNAGFPSLDPNKGNVDSHFINRLGRNSVYVFAGDVTPDDYDGDNGDPVMDAEVFQVNGSCFFQYDASGLSPGTYTVAFTNQAADDNPAADNTINFSGRTVVTIDGNGSIAHNFVADNILRVGPGQTYAKPSDAAAVVNAGDVVEIEAGTYAGDATYWDTDNITIRGVNGRAHMKAEGVEAGGKGIWVTTGNNIRIENIEFSEASVDDENGAGIRAEGNNLTVCNSYFHDNENGMLGGAYGIMIIEFSEFNYNGFGDIGYTHNIYVDDGETLIFRHNYSHHANIGHNLKTRARENYILYNRLMDETDGASSRAIDVPEGGLTYVIGNALQQSENTDNSELFAYGAEGLSGDGRLHKLYAVNNTFVNDRSGGGVFAEVAGGTSTVLFKNNLFVGNATTPSGLDATNIVTNSPGFVDRNGFDYHLLVTSTATNKGTSPGSGDGFDLTPVWQYLHPHSRETRQTNGALDAGAFEYIP